MIPSKPIKCKKKSMLFGPFGNFKISLSLRDDILLTGILCIELEIAEVLKILNLQSPFKLRVFRAPIDSSTLQFDIFWPNLYFLEDFVWPFEFEVIQSWLVIRKNKLMLFGPFGILWFYMDGISLTDILCIATRNRCRVKRS